MNLAHGYLAHGARLQSRKEIAAILENALAGVPLGKAKIQNLFDSLTLVVMGFQSARAARPRAESVNEPIELREVRSFQDSQAGYSPLTPLKASRQALWRQRLSFCNYGTHLTRLGTA
jgi:hypothetical protein